jgi:hypothetical protein
MELQATKKFMVHAIQNSPHLTNNLLGLFQNTKAGMKLTEKLFGCTIPELRKTMGAIAVSSSHNLATQLEQEDQKASISFRR